RILLGETLLEEGPRAAGKILDHGRELPTFRGRGRSRPELARHVGEKHGCGVSSRFADWEVQPAREFRDGYPGNEVVNLFDPREGAADRKCAVVLVRLVFQGKSDDVSTHRSANKVGLLRRAVLLLEEVLEGEGVIGADAGVVAVFAVGARRPGEAV